MSSTPPEPPGKVLWRGAVIGWPGRDCAVVETAERGVRPVYYWPDTGNWISARGIGLGDDILVTWAMEERARGPERVAAAAQQANAALPKPSEIAPRLYPPDGTGRSLAASDGVRAAYAAVREALEAEIAEHPGCAGWILAFAKSLGGAP